MKTSGSGDNKYLNPSHAFYFKIFLLSVYFHGNVTSVVKKPRIHTQLCAEETFFANFKEQKDDETGQWFQGRCLVRTFFIIKDRCFN